MATVETSSPIYAGFGGNDMGFGSGGFIWAFLIFALLMGGNGMFGGWGNNGFANAIGYENLATSNEVQRGFDNQNVMANQRETLSAINDASARGIAATNQVYHDVVANIGDKYAELQRDIGTLQVGQANEIANQSRCCCETKMVLADGFAQTNANIAQNRYDAAMNTAAINANTTAQTQKILDAIQQDKIDALRGRVNQLETQNLLGNVVRYPTSMSYNAGPSPFCNCGNGCGGYPLYS